MYYKLLNYVLHVMIFGTGIIKLLNRCIILLHIMQFILFKIIILKIYSFSVYSDTMIISYNMYV